MDNCDKTIMAEIHGIKELFQEKFHQNSEEHRTVISQVERTNGRVKTLELWRSFLIGAWTALMAIVIPICLKLF